MKETVTIAIVGAPATGKSSVSKALLEYLNVNDRLAYLISLDLYREAIVNDRRFYYESESLWFEVVLQDIRYLQGKVDCILVEGLMYDGNCLKSVLKYSHHFTSILLYCATSTRLIRNKERNKRLPDEEVIRLGSIDRGEVDIKIDTERPFTIVVDTIKEKLGWT